MPTSGERLLRQLALRLGSATPRVTTPAGPGFSGQPLTLYVQQLLKLAATGRTRRYEVLLRTRDTPSGEPALPQGLITAADFLFA